MKCTGNMLYRLLASLLCIATFFHGLAQDDKRLLDASKALQQSYNNLGVLLEKHKDTIIGSKQLRRQLKALNNATEQYFHLPDSMLSYYNRLPAYRSIDSVLRQKVTALPKKYVQSFLQLNKLDNHINQVKGLEQDLKSMYNADIRSLFTASYWQNMVRHNGFSANYSGQAGQSFFSGNTYWINNVQLADQVTINNVPLSMSYVYQQYVDIGFSDKHVWNAQFDKDAFLDNYRRKIQGKFKADDIVPKDMILETAIQSAESLLKKELDSLQWIYKDLAGGLSEKTASLKNITATDIDVIRHKLIGDASLEAIRDKERIVKELQFQLQAGQQADRERLNKLQEEITEQKAGFDIFNTIASHKKKWESSGLVKKIMADKNLRDVRFKELLNDPKSIKELAGKYFQLGGIEKWLMNVNSLRGGRQVSSLSSLSLNNFTSDGMSVEMQSGNKYLFVLMGRQQPFPSMYDAAAFTPLQPQGNLAMGVRIGTGALHGTHTHFSIFSYQNQPELAGKSLSNGIERFSMVMGLSNKLVSGPSIISVELSHAAMKFRNELKNELNTADPSNGAYRQRFTEGLALDVAYESNFEDIGLDVSVNGSVIGHDYYNPGNAFLTQGLKQFSFSGKKSVYKNQLQVRVRNTWRQFDFAQTPGNKWRQNLLMFDARWQLGKGQYLGVQFQPVRSVKFDGPHKYKTGMTDRLSAEFNFQQRVRGIVYRNLINLSHNKNYYTGSIGRNYEMRSSAVQLNTIQSIALKGHVIYWNTLYSHVYPKSNTYYLNSIFNTDAGFTYTIAKKLQASSGLSYYSVKDWYALAGVRQTFSASLGEKLQLSVFVDYRKKIKESQYYYNEPLRADCSARYIF
jgi:hypothetical protein